jgi:hypothetical protein
MAVALLLALVLAVPLRLWVRGERETGLGSLCGYAGVPLRILGMGFEVSETSSQYRIFIMAIPVWSRPLSLKRGGSDSGEKEKKRQKRVPTSLSEMLYLSKTPNVKHVTTRLLGLLNFRGELNCEVGFDDPSTTGMLAAAVALLNTATPQLKNNIRFNYLEAELKGFFTLAIFIWIPQLVVGTVVIALSREGRTLIIHLWRLRRKKRRARVL